MLDAHTHSTMSSRGRKRQNLRSESSLSQQQVLASFVLSVETAEKSQKTTDKNICHAFLAVLKNWGFETRVGAICCTPVTVGGQRCLLVSFRLVAVFAAVFGHHPCPNLTEMRADAGIRSLETFFFPQDFNQEAKRLAEIMLPIWPFKMSSSTSEIRDEIRLLNIDKVILEWNKIPETETILPAQYIKIIQKIVARVSRVSARFGHPRGKNEKGIAIGRALAHDQIDNAALDTMMELMGRPRAWGEHVGYGWRLTETPMRSVEEIDYDESFNYPVGCVEVLSGRPLPFPDVNISENAGPFALLAHAPPSKTSISKWLHQNAEASRLLLLTRGRCLVGLPCAPLLEEARGQQVVAPQQ